MLNQRLHTLRPLVLCVFAVVFVMLFAAVGAAEQNEPPPLNAGGSLLGSDFVLEIQTEPEPMNDILLSLGANLPRPGEAPQINTLPIITQAKLVFDSPFSPSTAELTNPEDSDMIMVYQLRISIAELMRQTGRTGYEADAYAIISAGEDFDPAHHYIVLSQSKGVLPGDHVEHIALGALPDGTTVPAGEYMGELIMVPFDGETRTCSMVNAIVMMPFEVKTGMSSLALTAERAGKISAFNQIDAAYDIVYSIQISQAEIERVSGSPHQSAEALAAQALTPQFNGEYEFISLYDSAPIAPGVFLEDIALTALPDGQPLPSGAYNGWLVRYTVDPYTGALSMLDANTLLEIIAP